MDKFYAYLINSSSRDFPHTRSSEFAALFLDHEQLPTTFQVQNNKHNIGRCQHI